MEELSRRTPIQETNASELAQPATQTRNDNLSPELVDLFEEKKMKLEKQYPGIFDLSLSHEERRKILARIERDNIGGSNPTSFMFVIFFILFLSGVAVVAYQRDGINVFDALDNFLMKVLDPRIPKTEL